MSNVQQEQDSFDFWEFVSCAKCRMPFALESGVATVPFWLTECGHVMCNNHINSDQSCAQCGSQGIQLTPLHREVEAPMSDWFQNIPSTLENVAYAAKFQQHAMASQLRYHKLRHQQLRQMLEKLKQEMSNLKRDNEALRSANQQYQAYHGHAKGADEPSNELNQNGKRIMLNHSLNNTRRPFTGSSPRSVLTPSGPDRLTLQPGQPVHELSSHKHTNTQKTSAQPQEHYLQQRPMSTRSLEKYAYTPQDNSSFRVPHLTYAQATPRFFRRADQQDDAQQPQAQRANNGSYQPPPSSSRFKPAPTQNVLTSAPVPLSKMGPPPVPRPQQNDGLPLPTANGNVDGGHDRPSMQYNNRERTLPLSYRINQPSSANPGTRAPGLQVPATPHRFFPSSRGQTRSSMPAQGQRRPFFPN